MYHIRLLIYVEEPGCWYPTGYRADSLPDIGAMEREEVIVVNIYNTSTLRYVYQAGENN